jgi:hypothetical protein
MYMFVTAFKPLLLAAACACPGQAADSCMLLD